MLRKDGEALLEVLRVFLEAVLSWKNPVLILLGLVIVLTLLGRLLKLRWTEEGSQLLFFAGASYLIYEVFVLAMYLTTMPYGEAVALAGYSRYHRTILIFCGACVFLAVAEALPDNLAIQSPAFLLTVILMYQSLFPGLWYNNPKHCGFVREEFQQLVTQSEVAHGKSYCVVVEAEYARKYSGYLQYLIRYLLNSADMKVCSVEEYRQKESGWENYAYLICFGESEEMDAFLLEQFGSTEQRVALKD